MRRTPLIPVALAAASLLATAFPTSAQAAEPEVLADGLLSALSVAVGDDGAVYAAQNFAATLTKIPAGGEAAPMYADEGQREVGAVSVSGDVVTFATTGEKDVKLYTLTPDGEGLAQDMVADLWAYESTENPDHHTTYGITGLKKSCKVAKAYRPHKGIKDAHPYGSETIDGITYVADAGANAVFAVNGEGELSTVAVLPPTNIKITKTVRKVLEVPKCAQGKTFRAEGVPTDVVAGPDGTLYVSSLPGGPEDPRMGANGAVYQIDPATGEVDRVVKGLVSPTGIAVGSDDSIYVASLFGNQVVAIDASGARTTFAEVAAPGDVDYANGYLYVTASGFGPTGPTPTGQVLKFPLGVG